MKKLFTLSLLAFGATLTSNAFAATGTGEAQAELTYPLGVSNAQNANLGTIAIDPGAGTQTITLSLSNTVNCPATYVCTGSAQTGYLQVTGALSTSIYIDITGSTATLDDGSGNTLTFDPFLFSTLDTQTITVGSGGSTFVSFGGTIEFTGNEVVGTYSSNNAGGSGFTVTVNY